VAAYQSLIGRTILDTYRIIRQIGAGGMGSIFEAEHVRMGRLFAVKLLDASLSENEEVFQRFKREAEIAGQLGHPNIVEVTDFNKTEDGVPFMVMEKLDGEDLADRIQKKGPFTFQAAFPILQEVIDALEAAHAAGIVHRDMKPQNIFLCKRGRRDDYVKLLDFGISKIKQSGGIQTHTNAVMGTPYYMSPEQAEGRNKDIDSRTDIFAMGAIIYEMLTAKLAFYAPSVPTAMFKVCYEEPPPIIEMVPNLPTGLAEVLAKALKKDKEERYASARALGDDLERVYSGNQATFETGIAHRVLEARSDQAPNPLDPTTLSGSASQAVDLHTLPPQRSSSLPLIIGVVGILAIVGAAFVVWMAMNKGDKGGGQKTVASDTMAPSADAAVKAPLSDEVTLTFIITPKDAQLFMNGKESMQDKGSVKRVFKMKRGEDPVTWKVIAPGYLPKEGELVPVEDQKGQINLTKEGSAPPRDEGTGFKTTPRSTGSSRTGGMRPSDSGTSARTSPAPEMTHSTPPVMTAPPPMDTGGMSGMAMGGPAADDI
jgi:serine/threonine protein kinase